VVDPAPTRKVPAASNVGTAIDHPPRVKER
jgi:hypothetical protein